MKAVIKQKSELGGDLKIEVVYDIVSGGEVLLDSQTLKAKPSELIATLSDVVARFKEEHEKFLELEVPTEVE